MYNDRKTFLRSTPKRFAACWVIARNWRLRRRLPRLTALAVSLGILKETHL